MELHRISFKDKAGSKKSFYNYFSKCYYIDIFFNSIDSLKIFEEIDSEVIFTDMELSPKMYGNKKQKHQIMIRFKKSKSIHEIITNNFVKGGSINFDSILLDKWGDPILQTKKNSKIWYKWKTLKK